MTVVRGMQGVIVGVDRRCGSQVLEVFIHLLSNVIRPTDHGNDDDANLPLCPHSFRFLATTESPGRRGVINQQQQRLSRLQQLHSDSEQEITNRLERLGVCNIVNHHDAIRTTVIVASDCPESLLTCCIPLCKTQ